MITWKIRTRLTETSLWCDETSFQVWWNTAAMRLLILRSTAAIIRENCQRPVELSLFPRCRGFWTGGRIAERGNFRVERGETAIPTYPTGYRNPPCPGTEVRPSRSEDKFVFCS